MTGCQDLNERTNRCEADLKQRKCNDIPFEECKFYK